MTDRISTPQFFQKSLNSLLDQQSRVSEAQLKISTGKRVNSPKDDPIATSRLLNLKQQEFESEQYQKNIDTLNSELSLEEVQLKNFLLQLNSVRDLALQANKGTFSPSNFKTVQSQAEEILLQMVSIANTNIDGEYMFAGSKSLVKPVTLDANGRYQYNGDTTQRSLQVGPSIGLEMTDNAKDLFFQIATDDTILTTTTGNTSIVSSSASGLTTTGTLGTIASGDFLLNGINIDASVADTVSPIDNAASAIATATAINKTTAKHGVVASANVNTVTLTSSAYSTGTLAANDFTINGTQITGAPATADAAGMVALINSVNSGTGVPGVIATVSGTDIQLIAADGRNIRLQSDSITASGITFANFDLNNGGAALDSVQRAGVTLKDHQTITIAGSSPSNVGFTANTYNLIANTGTGVISGAAIVEKRPDDAIKTENYLIQFDTATTFNIYKESDPTTAITNIKKFSVGENFKDAITLPSVPFDYVAGDTFIVDGVQFTLTGVPVAGDEFTLDLELEPNQNIFDAMQDFIDNLKNNSSNSPKLSYNIGQTLINFSNTEERVAEVRSKLGARLNLAEVQQKSNEEFIYFAKEGISNIEDLDIISGVSTLARLLISLEAAQRSIVQVQRLSIFNFL